MTLQYVKPTEDQQKIMQDFRDTYQELYDSIKFIEEDFKGRGLSLALTKLEESAMWLNKAITKND